MHIEKWRSQPEKSTYGVTPTSWHSGKGKSMQIIKSAVVAIGQRGGGMNGGAQRIFGGGETVLEDAIMVDTHHYTFVRARRTCITKTEPWGHLWTLDDNNMSMLVHGVWQVSNSRAGCPPRGRLRLCGGGEEVCANSLYFPLNFAVSLKLLHF